MAFDRKTVFVIFTALIITDIAGGAAGAATKSRQEVSSKAEQIGGVGAKKKQVARTERVSVPRGSRANEDARHCLQLSTNREIIKCAERYR